MKLRYVKEEYLKMLDKGVKTWNAWKKYNSRHIKIELSGADLSNYDLPHVNFFGVDLSVANLSGANLSGAGFDEANVLKANLNGANLAGAFIRRANFALTDLRGAELSEAHLVGTNLMSSDLSNANLSKAVLSNTILSGANLSKANLSGAVLANSDLRGANLSGADLDGADLSETYLETADFTGAELSGADFSNADLTEANLSEANLSGADLSRARMIDVKLTGATFSGCRVFGVSAWSLIGLEEAEQSNLIVTPKGEALITVDDVEIAQFIYLMLHSEKIRNVLNTIGKKGVLILGRFTERKNVLEAMKDLLRSIGYVPIVFDFEKPIDRDFTETVKTLAGMSRFIIAEITKPKSVPLELQATVPDFMIPMVPLIEKGEKPFSMFQDLWIKYGNWVLEPLAYDSIEQLQRVFQKAVVDPANQRLLILRKQKAEKMKLRDASEYE